MPAKKKAAAPAASLDVVLTEGQKVRLLTPFAGCPAGSEGIVTVIDHPTQAITMQVERKPAGAGGCVPFRRLIVGLPMRAVDTNCVCP
jgi:hypothetical protein